MNKNIPQIFIGNAGSVHVTRPKHLLMGISSQINRQSHIFLADFDNYLLSEVVSRCFIIQLKYRLPDIYILKSSDNHYHAVCFKKFSFKNYMRILKDSKCCDQFIEHTMKVRKATLRISPKQSTPTPKLILTISSNFPEEIKIKQDYFKLLEFEQK